MGHADPVIKCLQKYDPVSVLTVLSAGIAYPPNAVFLERFEYLMAKVLTMTQPYGTLEATQQGLERIFFSIPSRDAGWLALLEDFVPHNNLDDVRFCWRGKLWRFFFGNLERPMAYLRKFAREGSALDEWIQLEYGFSLDSALDFTLAYHDYLLGNLKKYVRVHEPSLPDPSFPPQFALPPDEFIEFWRSILPTTVDDLMQFASDRDDTWTWIQLFTREIGDISLDTEPGVHSLGLTTFVALHDHLLAPLPQLGVEQLLNQLAFLVEQAEQYQPEIVVRFREYTRDRMIRSSLRLFSDRAMSQFIPDVEVISGSSTTVLPMVIPLDIDKIVLFQVATTLGTQEELDIAVKEGIKRLSMAKAIFEPDEVTSVTLRDGLGGTTERVLQPGAFEAICILIVNILGMEEHTISIPEHPQGMFEVIPLMSYEALAQACEDGLEFVKFLRAWHQLKTEVSYLLAWDILDAWEIYVSNDHTFLRAGIIPDFIVFDAHSWSDAEHERLVSSSDLRRVLCEEHIRDSVLVHPDQSDAWRLFDPLSHLGWMIIPGPTGQSRLIFHICTKASNADEVELNESLAEGLAFHLEQWDTSFWGFCRDQLGFHWNKIEVFLHSSQVVRETLKNRALLSALDQHPHATFISLNTFRQEGTDMEPVFAVIYRADLLREILMGPDNRAERQFVTALLREIAAVGKRTSSGSDDLVPHFVDKHLPLGKKAINLTTISTLQTQPDMTEPRASQKADISWANMMVARHLREQGIAPGTYTEEDAITINTEVIIRFLMQLLLDAISQHNVSDLVLWTYNQLEQTESYRRLYRKRISADYQSIYLRYDPAKHLAKTEAQLAAPVEALALLLEAIVKHQPAGTMRLSCERWDRIYALTHVLYEVTIIDETIRFDLRPTALKIDEHYAVSLEPLGEDAIDFESFQVHRAKLQLPSLYRGPQDQDNGEKATYQPLLAARPELAQIDQAFKRCYGVDLEDFMVVMLGLVSYPLDPTNPYGRLVVATSSEICQTLNETIQGMNAMTIQQALDQLILTAQHMRTVEINPRKQREREQRLATRPIIQTELEGQTVLVFGPWFAERTLHIWQSHLNEGRVPLRDQDVPDPLRAALEAYRAQRTTDFENLVRERVEEIGMDVRRVKGRRIALALGLPESEDPGEIDALAVASEARRMFILEAKDITRSVTPRQVAREFHNKFYGSRGYVYQLERKVNFVRKHLYGVLHWLGYPDATGWDVVSAFVTRNIIPSAFATHSVFPIVGFDELEAWLSSQMSN